ncbi:MAG: hypothetical protein QOG10_118 [Kribbellaceae bacterium]|jgi:2-polyprenyl-6-methoxyphenol hydroxylase-like FAD-dependent oxidoreductase|nr:hypothetical protein [Kribbellaceae bacterium]
MNVLIAGAGPTGLTLAIDLARRGTGVRVIDKAQEYFNGSRGDGIQPRTLEVFDDLGVLDAILAAGAPLPLMRITIGGRVVDERRMSVPVEPTPDVPYPNPCVLGQSQTEGILRARLEELGGKVELATELVGIEQDDDGVTASLSTGETVRTDYVVGADGGRSFVRKALGIAFEGATDESIRMLLGDVSAEGLDHDYGYWFAGADNPMAGIALTPLPGGDQFQFGTPLDNDDVEPSLETLQGSVDKFAGPGVVKLSNLTWSTVWRPNVRLAVRFRVGRIFLAGDAAHVHPPTGGQGMNTGIQDAYNLGWKLADGREEILQSYEIERRTNAARVLGISTDLMRKHQEGDSDAMDRGEETQQLDISYRATDDTAPITVGDRAPDAPLLDADGNKLRLFDLFRGPHATLLHFGPGGDSTACEDNRRVVTVVRASPEGGAFASPDAFTAYHAAEGDEVLIRPDGYLAAITSSAAFA